MVANKLRNAFFSLEALFMPIRGSITLVAEFRLSRSYSGRVSYYYLNDLRIRSTHRRTFAREPAHKHLNLRLWVVGQHEGSLSFGAVNGGAFKLAFVGTSS